MKKFRHYIVIISSENKTGTEVHFNRKFKGSRSQYCLCSNSWQLLIPLVTYMFHNFKKKIYILKDSVCFRIADKPPGFLASFALAELFTISFTSVFTRTRQKHFCVDINYSFMYLCGSNDQYAGKQADDRAQDLAGSPDN